MALKVSAFMDVEVFKQRADGVIRQIRQGKRANGFDRIYQPGGLEAETEREYRSQGIPLNDATLVGLRNAAEDMGIVAGDLCLND
jgi:LDH2 family malate/lactate/ureidoglycolate dehydrogenase